MSKDEEEAQSRGFKVADRRRFVDHEDSADEAPADEAPAPEAPAPDASDRSDAQAARTEAPSPTATADQPAAAAAQTGDAAGPRAAAGAAGGPFPEMNFSTFVISLMTQALMHLGEVAEEGHPPASDLPAAKQMIDLLGILREKTTGNLDANEEQLLGQMLYDLRMRYVEVSRGS